MKSVLTALLVSLSIQGAAQTFLLDTSFPAGVGPDRYVRSLAVQPDGHVLIAGDFTNVNGIYRPGIARLNPDGSVDESFACSVTNSVRVVALAPDGSVLLSGYDTNAAYSLPGVARLRPDGQFDAQFALPAVKPANAYLSALKPAGAGRFWLTGGFTNIGGSDSARIARLRNDGSPDPSFRSPFRATDSSVSILPLPDGRLLVTGTFTNLGGLALPGFARLNEDGSLDPTFRPSLAPSNRVGRLTLLTGGILPGGSVVASVSNLELGEIFGRRLVRFLPDGAVDPGFNPPFEFPGPAYSAGIIALAAQLDGGLLVTGPFAAVNGVPRAQVARLLPDGGTDLCWDPGLGLDSMVLSLAVLPDGGVLLAGLFREVEGQPRPYLARLRPAGSCAPGLIQFGTAQARVSEDSPQASISVVRTGGADREQTVDFATTGGTATPGTDFEATRGMLKFGLGERTQTIWTPLRLDLVAEGDETVTLSLSNPGGGAALGAQTNFTLTIVDHTTRGTAGAVDTNFVAHVGQPVNTALALPGGGFLLGTGEYATGTSTGTVVRLLADGRPDATFAQPTCDGEVLAIARQPDGRILVGGDYQNAGGVFRPGLLRLNADGTLDESFQPFANLVTNSYPQSASVAAISLAEDGTILAAGSFRFAGQESRRVVKISPLGAVDLGFARDFWSLSEATALLALPDGSHLVGITSAGLRVAVARLLPSGACDPRFVPPLGQGYAGAMALEQGGSLLVVGFSMAPGLIDYEAVLSRLNPDGSESLDLARVASIGVTNQDQIIVRAIAPSGDGKLLVGGRFDTVSGVPRRCLARLHADGSLDPSFDPGAGATDRRLNQSSWTNIIPAEIRVLLPLPQGGWLVGGEFGGFDDVSQRFLVKLLPENTNRPPKVQLIVSQPSVPESGGGVLVHIVRTGDAAESASVQLATAPVTATAGEDFGAMSDVLNFAPGEWSKTVQAPVVNDSRVEPDETFRVFLTNASTGLVIAEPNAVTVTIVDDDVNVEFTATEFNGSEDDGFAVVGVRRCGVAGGPVQVSCRAGDVTGVTEFPARSSVWPVTNFVLVPIVDDSVRKPTGILALSLESASGATLGPRAQAILTVTDNDFTLAPARGVGGVINAMALSPQGGVYLAGEFTGVHGVPRRHVARLLASGEVDPAFDPGVGPDAKVTAIAVQPDGRAVIGGEFLGVAGVPRNRVARLNPDGSLDPTFDAGAGPVSGTNAPLITALAVQPDGRVLVGGRFTQFGGADRHGLARLETNGVVDAGFQPPFTNSSPLFIYDPAAPSEDNSLVTAIQVQTDGRVLVAGTLSVGSLPRFPLTSVSEVTLERLWPDGRPDTNFVPSRVSPWFQPPVAWCLRLQADNKILVGESYSRSLWLGITNWLAVRRLLASGQPDPDFSVRDMPAWVFERSVIRQVTVQTDERIIFLADVVEGTGNQVNRSIVGRLLPDGQWDSSFQVATATNPPPLIPTLPRPMTVQEDLWGAPGAIRTFVQQPDGILVVGGAFNEINGIPRRRLARLEADGWPQGVFELRVRLDPVTGGLCLALPPEIEWPYVVEQSVDLRVWTPVATNTAPWTGLELPITDEQQSHQFYRAVVMP